MTKLISIVGASGIGKTTLVRALEKARPFQTAYEQHDARPFQALFKTDARYALPNQMDYLLLRAEQERDLRASSNIALIDGGLDLDFHGFTKLFHARGFLSDPEFDLCNRFYSLTRSLLPFPDLIVSLSAPRRVLEERLKQRNRINIANSEDAELFNAFVNKWLETLPEGKILHLDVSHETENYSQSVGAILRVIPP
jgi:deoxyadenosine/deoxycytidine kinase